MHIVTTDSPNRLSSPTPSSHGVSPDAHAITIARNLRFPTGDRRSRPGCDGLAARG